MGNFFESFTRPPKESPVGSYVMQVVSLPEELDWEAYLPLELRYIFTKNPAFKERLRRILSQGKALGVRTVRRTPENILKAVHALSTFSQHNYITTWLPKLLRDKHFPVFSAQDNERCKTAGEGDLNQAVKTIFDDRLRFKRLVLIDEENIGITFDEQRLVKEFSEIIYPLAVDYAVFRVVADNARERTQIAQNIIKALLFIGPIAHFLEKYLSGIGKVFAASADDLLGESAEIMALRGSGFSWKVLLKRSRILIPIFIVATYGAFQVEPLLEEGRIALAGIVFGLAAVALSLTTAVQSVFLYRHNAQLLLREKKHELGGGESVFKLAIVQDFTNPARLGLLIGAGLAPVMGMLGAYLGLLSNGWVLAAIGSTESIVAGFTVLAADKISQWRFNNSLRRKIGNTRI